MIKFFLVMIISILSTVARAQLKVHSNGSITLNARKAIAPDTPTVKIDSFGMSILGRLGIGTTVPNASTNYGALDVNGANGGMLYMSSRGAWKGRIYGNDGSLSLESNGALPMTFYTNGNARLNINGSGAHTIAAPSAGIALSVNGISNQWATNINAGTTPGQSYGLLINAGTNGSDNALHVRNNVNSAVLLDVRGDGNALIPSGSLTVAGAGSFGNTLSAAQSNGITGVFRSDWDAGATNNSQVYVTGYSNTNKQLRLGYETTSNYGYIQSVVNGAGPSELKINPGGGTTTFGGSLIVSSNADPTISVTSTTTYQNAYLKLNAGSGANAYINSTGGGSLILGANGAASNHVSINSTGAVNIAVPSSGIALNVNGPNGNWTEQVIGGTTNNQSYGLLLTAGTTISDYGLYVQNRGGSAVLLTVRGDGSVAMPSGSLTVSGSMTSNGGSFSSMRALKDVNGSFDQSGLQIVRSVKVEDFHYKTRTAYDRTAGFIVDEIPEQYAPWLLSGEKKDAINVYSSIGIAFKAIQEIDAKSSTDSESLKKIVQIQQDKISKQEEQLTKQQEQINELQEQVQKLMKAQK